MTGNENENEMEKHFFCPDYDRDYSGGIEADNQGAGKYEMIALVYYV